MSRFIDYWSFNSTQLCVWEKESVCERVRRTHSPFDELDPRFHTSNFFFFQTFRFIFQHPGWSPTKEVRSVHARARVCVSCRVCVFEWGFAARLWWSWRDFQCERVRRRCPLILAFHNERLICTHQDSSHLSSVIDSHAFVTLYHCGLMTSPRVCLFCFFRASAAPFVYSRLQTHVCLVVFCILCEIRAFSERL